MWIASSKINGNHLVADTDAIAVDPKCVELCFQLHPKCVELCFQLHCTVPCDFKEIFSITVLLLLL